MVFNRIFCGMKCFLGAFLLAIGVLSFPLFGSASFKLVESWNHGNQPFSYLWYSTIGSDGSVVAAFVKAKGVRLITPKQMVPFAFEGEGADDIRYAYACFPYKNDIGFHEQMLNRIKIFTRTEKGMKWKETIWFKRGIYPHLVKGVLFADDKFFFAGEGELPGKGEINQFYLVKAYDTQGKLLKELIHYEQKGLNEHAYMKRHLLYYKGQVFLISENELSVQVINTKDLSEKGEVKLTAPSFYKKMPDSFYTTKKYPAGSHGLPSDLEEWSVGYSRIFKAEIDGDYIVLAIRTCDPKLKKFCLLYYRADTFKLANQVFLDDYLLGARDGRYYCFSGGDPSLDDNTDCCCINVYQWVDTK